MSAETLLTTLWRRKTIVLLTVVVATLATYFVSRSLHKVYTAQATLFVGDRNAGPNDFAAVQSGQVLAKTYAELIQSKAVAGRVAATFPGSVDPTAILNKTSFQPVTETQLLTVKAEGRTGADAAALANAYASTFATYASTNLAPQTRSNVAVVDRALAPQSPTRPRPSLYAAIMFVVALFLGSALALLRDRLDTRLRDDREVAEALELPVLARVPLAPRRDGSPQAERFLEAFRILRTNLRFTRPGAPLTSLLVTSAGASEGKSTSAVALARSFAEQGNTVVVIEADLRRPGLEEMMEMDHTSRMGLTQALVLGLRSEEVAFETPLVGVHLIPAGAVPPNPSSLLQLDGLRRLIQEARDWADVVIVDSPPLSAGADASVLAQVVDAVLFVVNQRSTRRPRALAAVRQLRQAGGNLAGLIVNEMSHAGDFDAYYFAAATNKGGSPNKGRSQNRIGSPDESTATSTTKSRRRARA